MSISDWDFVDDPVLPGYPWPRRLTPRGHPFGRQMAEFLCEVRIQSGMTQAGLAGALDTTQPAIAKLESARHLPSVGMLVRIAEATCTPMAIVATLHNPALVTDRVELWPPPGALRYRTWPLT